MRRGRILVVDDDPSIRDMVSDCLELEGYQVDTAGDGLEGLRVIERKVPSLVLLDMRMPRLDGWGFARTLRERGIKLPILMLTASPSPRQWAEEISADAYLSKPFDISDLLTTVARMVLPTIPV